MGTSVLGFFGGEDICSLYSSQFSTSNCFAFVIFSLASLSFACLPIIFIGEAAWSAFKKRRHWIPAGSLVLGALVLQFLPILNKSFNFPGDVFSKDQQNQVNNLLKQNDYSDYEDQEKVNRRYSLLIFYSNWVSVLCGRVSMFVLMGCLLPGVARPLSSTLWRDMAALIISSSLSFFHISYETYRICKIIDISYSRFWIVLVCNLVVLVSLVILVLLLVSTALASVSICKTWSHKIPTMLCAHNFTTEFEWEEVEKRASQSLIVARTADPQYIMARSILTSSVALLVTVCNGILVFQAVSFSDPEGIGTFLDIWFVLRCVVIVTGSIIIYWRCITAVVFYQKGLGWKPSSLAQFFQIENYWKTQLLDYIDSFNTQEESGDRSLGKLIVRLCTKMRLHKLLYVLHYLQMFSIFLSKICWLLAQLFFCNKYSAKLLLGSAYDEFCNLSRSKSHKESLEDSNFGNYFESLVVMQGENRAGIWMATKNSIQEIKDQMGKGYKEGRECTALISFLKEYSRPDFHTEGCVRLQIGPDIRLEVERELDVERQLNAAKCSWKMVAVSIFAFVIELSSFTEGNDIVATVKEPCSQAWNIMNMVEISDVEAVELSKAADNLFQSLQKENKWLDYCLLVSKPVGRKAEEAMDSLLKKGKQIAVECETRKWTEAVAAYNLYKVGLNINDQFDNVEVVLNKLKEMLADVIGFCIVKAVGVMMEDCKKQAALYDEESILRIAGVAGKVKGVTEKLEWKLKWSEDKETQIN